MSQVLSENIEWSEFFERVVERTREPDETTADILTGGYYLGDRRARLLARRFREVEDVPFSLSLFCWWPFKLEVESDLSRELRAARKALFSGLAEMEQPERRSRLDRVVPDEVLRFSLPELYENLASGTLGKWFGF